MGRSRRVVSEAGTWIAAGADQVLFSLGGFAISWTAARTLEAGDLAAFAIAWQLTFGGIALLSEWIVAPAIVRETGGGRAGRVSDVVSGAAWWTAVPVAVSAVPVLALWPIAGQVLLSVSLALGGFAFVAQRAFAYATDDVPVSLRASSFRFLVAAVMLGGVVTIGDLGIGTALGIGTVSFLLPPLRAGLPSWDIAELRRLTRGLTAEGGWYVAAMALRVVGFTGGLLAVMASSRGLVATAVAAGLLTLVGPVQLLSSTLPMVFMPRLVRAVTSEEDWRPTFGQQLIAVVAAVGMASVVGWTVFRWWAMVTLGDPRLVEALAPHPGPFLALIVLIPLGTVLEGAVKALRKPRHFTTAATVAALLGVGAALFGAVPARWVPVAPHATLVAGSVIVVASAAARAGVGGSPRDPGGVSRHRRVRSRTSDRRM